MRALIRPWEPGATYQYSDIVQLNGMTYQAEASDVRLIAPDAATADGAVLWRRWYASHRPRRCQTQKPPVVMPSPDMPIDGTSTDAGVDAAGFSVGEGRPRRAATQTAPIAVMTVYA